MAGRRRSSVSVAHLEHERQGVRDLGVSWRSWLPVRAPLATRLGALMLWELTARTAECRSLHDVRSRTAVPCRHRLAHCGGDCTDPRRCAPRESATPERGRPVGAGELVSATPRRPQTRCPRTPRHAMPRHLSTGRGHISSVREAGSIAIPTTLPTRARSASWASNVAWFRSATDAIMQSIRPRGVTPARRHRR